LGEDGAGTTATGTPRVVVTSARIAAPTMRTAKAA
jgi:hypothetical protein